MIIINEIMFLHIFFFFFFFFFFYTDYQLYIFFINCIYCIVLIVYIVLARTCFNERFSLLNVAWLNKVLLLLLLLFHLYSCSSNQLHFKNRPRYDRSVFPRPKTIIPQYAPRARSSSVILCVWIFSVLLSRTLIMSS